MSNQEISMIKFKRTQGNQEAIQLAFESNRRLDEYVSDLADLYDAEATDIKLVFKGKILNLKDTAQSAKLQNGTVMVVINNTKKEPKKTLTSKEQVVPGAGMSTGLGSSSPFGVGGYSMVNHPQYMSAISSAVDPDKVEEMLDDPQYEGMMQQMLQDPDTLRQLMEQNPTIKNMMNNNPMMKSMLSNPAMLKMIFNKQTLKKTKQYIKNGGKIQQIQQNPMIGNQFLGSQGFSGSFPAFPQNLQQPNNNLNNGFGAANPLANPFGGYNLFSNPQAQTQMQRLIDQNLYKAQLKQLQLMGFKDKAKNLAILKEVNGNVDSALEKLCSD